MRNKEHRSLTLLIAAIAAAAVIGGAFGFLGAMLRNPEDAPAPAETAQSESGESGTAAAARILPSVVGVRAAGESEQDIGAFFESSGSGVVIDGRGYIVTNHHVIAGADRVSVTFADGGESEAAVVGSDPRTDLALLKTEKSGLTAARFSEETAKVGETVYAVGNPGGGDFAGTVTRGIVSGVDRVLVTDDGASFSLLQTDAAINPGNSGGALCDSGGAVIGINAVKISEIGVEGMGFAIPAATVREITAELLDHGTVRRGALGVYLLAEVDKSFAVEYNTGIDHGVVVSPREDGAAANAGLAAWDIITAVNGDATDDIAALQRAVFALDAGDLVTVTYWRDGAFHEADIVLEELRDE